MISLLLTVAFFYALTVLAATLVIDLSRCPIRGHRTSDAFAVGLVWPYALCLFVIRQVPKSLAKMLPPE